MFSMKIALAECHIKTLTMEVMKCPFFNGQMMSWVVRSPLPRSKYPMLSSVSSQLPSTLPRIVPSLFGCTITFFLANVCAAKPLMGSLITSLVTVCPLPRKLLIFFDVEDSSSVLILNFEEGSSMYIQCIVFILGASVILCMEEIHHYAALFELEDQYLRFKSRALSSTKLCVHALAMSLLFTSGIWLVSLTGPMLSMHNCPHFFDWSLFVCSTYSIFLLKGASENDSAYRYLSLTFVWLSWIFAQTPLRPSAASIVHLHVVAWILTAWSWRQTHERAEAFLFLKQTLALGPILFFMDLACLTRTDDVLRRHAAISVARPASVASAVPASTVIVSVGSRDVSSVAMAASKSF